MENTAILKKLYTRQRECEKCTKIVCSRRSTGQYYGLTKHFNSQTGESIKYPNEIASFCKRHVP